MDAESDGTLVSWDVSEALFSTATWRSAASYRLARLIVAAARLSSISNFN